MPAASPTEPPGTRRALPGDSELVSELITGDPDEPDKQRGAAKNGQTWRGLAMSVVREICYRSASPLPYTAAPA